MLTRIFLCLLTLALLAPALHAQPAPASQPAGPWWPQFNGPQGDNRSTDQGLLKKWPAEGPPLLWRYDECGIGFSAVAVADNMIFTAGDFGDECRVLAFDMTGKLLWSAANGKSWPSPWSGSRSTPTYNDGLVYHLNAHGRLAAYEAKTGKPVWDFQFNYGRQLSQGGFAESVAIDGNNLICMPGGPEEFILALDKKTGKKVWVSDFKQSVGWDRASYVSPLLVDYKGRRHIIYLSLFRLVSLDAQTGKVEWAVSHRKEKEHCEVVAVSPIWLDGRIYVTKGYSHGSHMFEIDPSGTAVKELWTHADSDSEHGAAVHDNGAIYIAGNYRYPLGGWNQKEAKAGVLYCLDVNTGQPKWTAPTGRVTLTYADGHLYALNEFSKLSLIEANAEKCNIVSEFQLPKTKTAAGWSQSLTHPVVVGGRLYVRNHNSVYVYNIKN